MVEIKKSFYHSNCKHHLRRCRVTQKCECEVDWCAD